MSQSAHAWTRAEVLALPEDGKRYELIDGELLVSPVPSYLHQFAVGGMYLRINPYVDRQSLGDVLFSPADLDLNSGQLSQPDLFVLPPTPVGQQRRSWADAGIPLLAVEVLSPSTARFDRFTKRVRYQRSGVGEYWIIDTDARLVERWTPADDRPEVLDAQITWAPPGATESLVIDLAAFFREVWRER